MLQHTGILEPKHIAALHASAASWSAAHDIVHGRHLVVVTLTDGAAVYLDPSVAHAFGRQLIDAAVIAFEAKQSENRS